MQEMCCFCMCVPNFVKIQAQAGILRCIRHVESRVETLVKLDAWNNKTTIGQECSIQILDI